MDGPALKLYTRAIIPFPQNTKSLYQNKVYSIYYKGCRAVVNAQKCPSARGRRAKIAHIDGF
jgi:hypothetical protein